MNFDKNWWKEYEKHHREIYQRCEKIIKFLEKNPKIADEIEKRCTGKISKKRRRRLK